MSLHGRRWLAPGMAAGCIALAVGLGGCQDPEPHVRARLQFPGGETIDFRASGWGDVYMGSPVGWGAHWEIFSIDRPEGISIRIQWWPEGVGDQGTCVLGSNEVIPPCLVMLSLVDPAGGYSASFSSESGQIHFDALGQNKGEVVSGSLRDVRLALWEGDAPTPVILTEGEFWVEIPFVPWPGTNMLD